jgi:hypothetical protein
MPRTLTRFVRHLDGVAEVGNRFLESGTGQRLVASLAPLFEGCVSQASLRKMMREELRPGQRGIGKAVARLLCHKRSFVAAAQLM